MSIKFEIYRDGSRVINFAPQGAIAIGPESVPIPGEVHWKDGLLVCEKTDDHATAVGLLWDCGTVGTYHVETTRLPPREKPYNMNVELARFRLMRIVQKQEDWNLFDFPRAERFTQLLHEAQQLFADALGKLDQPGEAAKLADQSLAMSVDLSEQLAMFHGDLLLNRRRASGAFVKHVVGCRVNSQVQNTKYRETLAENFDYVVLPMSWKQLQPEEQTFNTETVDDWVELLAAQARPDHRRAAHQPRRRPCPRLDVHLGTRLRHAAGDGVRVRAKGRAALPARRRRVERRLSLHAGAAFALSFEQIIELTRMLIAQVKTILPNAKTLVSITHPFGEYHAKAGVGVPPMLYAEMVAQAGVNFEAFGLELEMGVPKPGNFTATSSSSVACSTSSPRSADPLSHRRRCPEPQQSRSGRCIRRSIESRGGWTLAQGLGSDVASRVDGRRLQARLQQALRRKRRVGRLSPILAKTSPAAACSTTCSNPSPATASSRNSAKSSTSGTRRRGNFSRLRPLR
jgi:hypothetical protein